MMDQLKNEISFTTTEPMSQEAIDLFFQPTSWWENLRASVSEGFCPECKERLIPSADASPGESRGVCLKHGLFWTKGPDKEFAADGWNAL